MFYMDGNVDKYKLSSYMFDLPAERIAQYPAMPRDHSRLLVLDRSSGTIRDKYFYDLESFVQPGDALVLNETRVIPARLLGYKATGGQVEILLLAKNRQGWDALVRPGRRLKEGHKVYFAHDRPEHLEILGKTEVEGGRVVAFRNCLDEEALIEEIGHIPLPPYINRPDETHDRINYQTVYARKSGSAAAPTAGLHFTPQLLTRLELKGINIVRLTLHVGLGTFRPVSSTDIRDHIMHNEYYQVGRDAAMQLNTTRRSGGRVVAVGTTVVRALETMYGRNQGFYPDEGETSIFIYPGYQFQAVDALITNFHLPGSSLLMLVSAFAGWVNTRNAYEHALNSGYRFFSYGDAMLII